MLARTNYVQPVAHLEEMLPDEILQHMLSFLLSNPISIATAKRLNKHFYFLVNALLTGTPQLILQALYQLPGNKTISFLRMVVLPHYNKTNQMQRIFDSFLASPNSLTPQEMFLFLLIYPTEFLSSMYFYLNNFEIEQLLSKLEEASTRDFTFNKKKASALVGRVLFGPYTGLNIKKNMPYPFVLKKLSAETNIHASQTIADITSRYELDKSLLHVEEFLYLIETHSAGQESDEVSEMSSSLRRLLSDTMFYLLQPSNIEGALYCFPAIILNNRSFDHWFCLELITALTSMDMIYIQRLWMILLTPDLGLIPLVDFRNVLAYLQMKQQQGVVIFSDAFIQNLLLMYQLSHHCRTWQEVIAMLSTRQADNDAYLNLPVLPCPEKDRQVVLSNLNLARAKFNGQRALTGEIDKLCLPDLVMNTVCLTEVRLDNAVFSGANMCAVNLRGAYFESVDLQKAEITNTDMSYMCFINVDLTNVIIKNTSMDYIKLEVKTIQGATFRDVSLRGANFNACNISSTVFQGCDLRGACFIGVNFSQTKFVDCKLDGARFVYVHGFESGCKIDLCNDLMKQIDVLQESDLLQCSEQRAVIVLAIASDIVNTIECIFNLMTEREKHTNQDTIEYLLSCLEGAIHHPLFARKNENEHQPVAKAARLFAQTISSPPRNHAVEMLKQLKDKIRVYGALDTQKAVSAFAC